MTDAKELTLVMQARIRDFEAAMKSITDAVAQVIAATEDMGRDAQLLFLITMRDEFDASIREHIGAQPEPAA